MGPVQVVIVTSSCGGVLIAAKAAKEGVLKRFPDAVCSIVPIDDLWPGASVKSYERYLLIARNGYYTLIRCLSILQNLVIWLYRRNLNKGLREKLQEYSPDVIVSTAPLINDILMKLAQERGAGFFAFSADMDCRLFSQSWPKGPDLPAHRFGIFYDLKPIVAKLHPHIEPRHVVYLGGYARTCFLKAYSDKEKEQFRKDLGLPAGKTIVSLMMGSLGGHQLIAYVRRLVDEGELIKPTHVVVFCAKNRRLVSMLQKIVESAQLGSLSFSFEKYTDAVYKYFALSSGLITKPGAASISEALAQNLPMLIDGVKGQFPWEKTNAEVVIDQGLDIN